MKFQELTEKEYQKYWENHPLKTFLSSPEISKLREKRNWETFYVGVKENNKIMTRQEIIDQVNSLLEEEFEVKSDYSEYSTRLRIGHEVKEILKCVKPEAGSRNHYVTDIVNAYIDDAQKNTGGK